MNAPLLHPRAAARREPRPSLLAVGLDHHSAPLELRERVALSRADNEGILHRLLARPEIEEAFVLSTCNRTEVYLLPREPEGAYRAAMDLVFGKAPEVERDGRFWVLREDAVARHLLAVAAGLESMVLGEPEILGQVRRAAEL